MIYLKAYQAYQQQNYDQCLKLLQELKQNDAKKLDLLAQVHFQKKEYQKAYDIYQDLIERGGKYSLERRDNLLAVIVCAQLDQPGVLKTKGSDKIPTSDDIIDQVELLNLKDITVEDVCSKPDRPNRSKKNKKRKIRLPKQYDPVSGPDPERWLPRRDRKSNLHKNKKRRQRPNVKGKARVK